MRFRGARHLFGLKEILYEQPYENEEKIRFMMGLHFGNVTVKDEIYIDQHNIIADLFAMTPYYWKTTIQGSERLKHTETLKTEIHFDFLIYQENIRKGDFALRKQKSPLKPLEYQPFYPHKAFEMLKRYRHYCYFYSWF